MNPVWRGSLFGMEDGMIERVGREILEAHSQWEKENNRLGGQDIWDKPHLDLLARIAINAMREPTLAMIQAGWATNGYRGDMTEREWRAMIDAALGAETASPAER